MKEQKFIEQYLEVGEDHEFILLKSIKKKFGNTNKKKLIGLKQIIYCKAQRK